MTQPSSSTPPLSSSASPVAVSVGIHREARSPLSAEANDENRVANHSIPFVERLPESTRDRPIGPTASAKEATHEITAIAWKTSSDNQQVDRRSSYPLPPLAATFKRAATTTTPRQTVDPQQLALETRSALTPRHNDANAPVSGEVPQEESNSENLIFNDNPLLMKAMPAAVRSTGSAVDSTPPRPTAAVTRATDSQGGGSSLSDPFNQRSRSFEQNRRPPTESTRSSSPSIIRDTPTRRPSGPRDKDSSLHSQRSSILDSPGTQVPPRSPLPNADWGRADPETQEQALFEQRLCEDVFGVAVRKINQNGKSNLRYVKCILLDDHESLEPSAAGGGASTRSIGSRRNASRRKLPRERSLDPADGGSRNTEHPRRALTWGKKKDVVIPLDRFICVRKGKTTERTRKNGSPATRLLSLISDDPEHASLDIEAPTRLDRDKFARAFSRFLGVTLEGEDSLSAFTDSGERKQSTGIAKLLLNKERFSAAHSAPDLDAIAGRSAVGKKDGTRIMNAPLPVITAGSSEVGQHLELKFDMVGEEPVEPESPAKQFNSSSSFGDLAGRASVPLLLGSLENRDEPKILSMASSLNNLPSDKASTTQQAVASTDIKAADAAHTHEGDDGTVVSSLTGAGFDHEIVEELHQALNELRTELEESRAEAARAIKVAEQAIQSAENTNSKDWNSTVTHKAAAAAALAQKKSAEAMAKQRLAEERLAGERRTAAFWRRQAEAAEEEAGALQTRAAAAEVQRAAMEEELESERRTAKMLLESLKDRFSSSEVHQREAIESSMERNRALELELDTTRRELLFRNEEAKILQESLSEMIPATDNIRIGVRKKLARIGRPKKNIQDSSASKMLLAVNSVSSSSTAAYAEIRESASGGSETLPTESILKLHAETTLVRKQFELLRRATVDELETLPANAKLWAEQASRAIVSSQDEVVRLREKLALESATRRKLLHEVQDLRGIVRVYCRPRPSDAQSSPKSGALVTSGLVSIPSHETLLLHRDKSVANADGSSSTRPMSFEFDRVFSPDMSQRDVYNELEEVCLGVLDGYNICIMAYGQTGSGKTHTLLGDVQHSQSDDVVTIENEGIQLQAARQLFYVAEQRSERYKDVFTFSIVEVYNERLCDLVAGTPFSEKTGRVVIEEAKLKRNTKKRLADSEGDGSSTQPPGSVSSKPAKLEIWTNQNGDTVVHGLTTVEVTSLEDIRTVWGECIVQRAARLSEQGIDVDEYESASHVIATLKVVSTNITTGIASVGKVQFVDLAGADLIKRKPSFGAKKPQNSAADGLLAGVGNNNDWKFANKSLATLSEVVNARCQFMRSVPYRNSTLTHLLRDSLEADTKVIMVVCVSSSSKDMQETACSLRFGARMRRVTIGKATKHTLSNS